MAVLATLYSFFGCIMFFYFFGTVWFAERTISQLLIKFSPISCGVPVLLSYFASLVFVKSWWKWGLFLGLPIILFGFVCLLSDMGTDKNLALRFWFGLGFLILTSSFAGGFIGKLMHDKSRNKQIYLGAPLLAAIIILEYLSKL